MIRGIKFANLLARDQDRALRFWTEQMGFVLATDAELQANGVETMGPPKKAEWGSSLMFRDPDGTQYLISTR